MSALVDPRKLERLRDQRLATMKADHLEIIGQPAAAWCNGFVGDRDRLIDRDDQQRPIGVSLSLKDCTAVGRLFVNPRIV